MPVEKMEMLSAVGLIDEIDSISKEMIKCGCIHVVNAMEDIKHCAAQDEAVLEAIKPYEISDHNSRARTHLDEMMEILGVNRVIRKKYIEENDGIDEALKDLEPIYSEVVNLKHTMDKYNDDLKNMMEVKENIENIKGLNFAISELKGLKFFSFSIGRLHKDYYSKLKENIENIPSIIYGLSSTKNYNIIVSFTPKFTESETREIFKSLGYEEIIIPERVKGVPEKVLARYLELIEERKSMINEVQNKLLNLKQAHEEYIIRCFNLLEKDKKTQQINREAACTERVFYISGWIPEIEKKSMENKLQGLEDKMVTVFRHESDVMLGSPPTLLRNSWLAEPFEYLVNMYGIPSYNEIDPTLFVALSYMIMFGAMFGDVGQGFILLAGGVLLLSRKSYEFGGILVRVGISSMVFGLLYGSVFGSEEVIKPLLLRPLENINTVLLGGVVLGVILSTISYIFNFFNSARENELEEGLFGREGAAGFLFFCTILVTAYWIARYNRPPLPMAVIISISVILLLLIVLKQPLSRLIQGKRPLHHDPPGDYYVESAFGVIETILSMLSKTISFIRLGAFALNHVGLFIAFSTISNMINNRAGSIAVLVLGNIIIIGLEGLVVFIQGLRLEYYELFSRFYRGDGTEYRPICIEYNEKSRGDDR